MAQRDETDTTSPAPAAARLRRAAPPEPMATPGRGEAPAIEVRGGDVDTGTEAPAGTASGGSTPKPAADTLQLGPRHGRLVGARQAVRGWRSRPAGRLALSGLLVLAMLLLAGAAGAYAVPRLLAGSPADRAAGRPGPVGPVGPVGPIGPVGPTAGSAAPFPTLAATPSAGAQGQLADALAPWAAPIAAKLDIPPVALQAYGFAELIVATTQPQCQLRWTTLAAIGKVESNHGRSNATLGANGRALPPIVGAALDGTGGRLRVADTDAGQLDGDTTWDHAVGPMQFIPATWQQYQVDADKDGVADPNDINDAALAAADYLCAGGRDLSTGAGWWSAVLSYNAVQQYAQDVFTAANDYGQRSRG